MPVKERIAPAMQREMIIDLIYELCSDLLPEDDKSLPPQKKESQRFMRDDR